MANTKKENEVINKPKTSKNTTSSNTKKVSAKKTVKKTTTSTAVKKDTRKEYNKNRINMGVDRMFNSISSKIKSHKITSICIAIIIVLMTISLIFASIAFSNKTVITVDKYNFNKSDFMIYLYSVKYNYFGKDNTNLPEATLNTLVDEESNITMREYLKERTVKEIKTAGVIKKLASEYKIKLSKKDEEELLNEKQEFIQELGGKKAFKKMLKDNSTTEAAYDKMSRTDKLYKLIYNEMYTEGKSNDLSKEEKDEAKDEYYNNYKMIRQVVLSLVDASTKKGLDSTTINQKQTLAETILKEAKSGANFDDLIKKYSEAAIGEDPPYYVYYKDGEMLDEVEKAVNKLNVGDISDVVKSDYALHIIIRDELDDKKLPMVYDQKREEKLLEKISNTLKDVPIIYHDTYTSIKIK